MIDQSDDSEIIFSYLYQKSTSLSFVSSFSFSLFFNYSSLLPRASFLLSRSAMNLCAGTFHGGLYLSAATGSLKHKPANGRLPQYNSQLVFYFIFWSLLIHMVGCGYKNRGDWGNLGHEVLMTQCS